MLTYSGSFLSEHLLIYAFLKIAPSKQSPPFFEVLTAKSLNVKWESPDYPNG